MNDKRTTMNKIRGIGLDLDWGKPERVAMAMAMAMAIECRVRVYVCMYIRMNVRMYALVGR